MKYLIEIESSADLRPAIKKMIDGANDPRYRGPGWKPPISDWRIDAVPTPETVKPVERACP